MSKKSVVQRNIKREMMSCMLGEKRRALASKLKDESLSMAERFSLQAKLSKMPRDSSKIRVRNRCLITGRPRGYYRKFKMSRIVLRQLGSVGQIPGLTKSSW